VRLVFSGAVQSGEGIGGGGAMTRGLSFARANSQQLGSDEERQSGRVRDVLAALEAVVEEQTTEITHICRCGALYEVNNLCGRSHTG